MDRTDFEYAEHMWLGDGLTLKDENGTPVIAGTKLLALPNSLSLTYGQINGLAGDFYGTYEPISDGSDMQDQSTRFLAAWHWLAVERTRQPQEANDILAVLKQEVDAVKKAFEGGEDPSKAYAHAGSVAQMDLEAITFVRPMEEPGYLGLSLINFDHFGEDARTAYIAGHWTAIRTAIQGKGDPAQLWLSYAMNAFADHYLQDLFSAGHARTPRRYLHSGWWPYYDRCAQLMHDEDDAIGLAVTNPAGTRSWTMYGDKRVLDRADDANRRYCQEALQASADEIWAAWHSGTEPSQYAALQIAPTLESARGPQKLSPLVKVEDGMGLLRSPFSDRASKTYTPDWRTMGLVGDAAESGLWEYPIRM